MTDDKALLIAACANVADEAVAELTAILNSPKARKDRYDRATPVKLRYTIRWAVKIRDRIKEIDPNMPPAPPSDDERLQRAIRLLEALRPMIEATRSSTWRMHTLHEIDRLIGLNQSSASQSD
jgi:hypothetical protein